LWPLEFSSTKDSPGSLTVQDGNWGGVDSVGNWGSVVSRGGGVVGSGGSIVMGLSLVGHISNITVIVVGMVGHMLDTAVGKVDGVRASNNTVTVIVLLLLESGSTVVISHSVGVLVGAGLGQIVSNVAGLHGGMISGSVMDNWGVMDDRCVVRSRGWGISWGGVVDTVMSNQRSGVMDTVMSNKRSGMVDTMVRDGMMTNNMVSSMQPVGSISNDGSVGSEGLALGGGPVLSLVRFAH
jgi:hypothetical protein